MRAWRQPPETEAQERYLGEIAPLLAAARQLDTLSPVERRQVRKRILRTLFGTRSVRLRGRLLPVLVAIALLVVGGAAFATARRLGLLPGLGSPKAGSSDPATEAPKRKKSRSRPRGVAAISPEHSVGTEPTSSTQAPAPAESQLLSPPSGTWRPTDAPGPSANGGRVDPAPALTLLAPKSAGRSRARREMSASRFFADTSADRPAPVIPAPPERPAVTVAPGRLMETVPAAPSPSFVLPAASEIPTPAPVVPAAAKPTPAAERVVPAAPPAKSLWGDQTLFGKALRKLRAERDAAGALVVLGEHAKAFPGSALAGERKALEVEALLALDRDREALALLDTMPLAELPRSGERLVVRGELRAAAKRWREAHADFDLALARVSGSPAWHERALWGRGVTRLRLGERAAGLADIERYRDTYPAGRFAVEAAKVVPSR